MTIIPDVNVAYLNRLNKNSVIRDNELEKEITHNTNLKMRLQMRNK